ncbi:MAG TPA: flagellar biosynthetic protein FliR [Rhodopila sp.]|nr:flagellar biosynthetic protein FliR [Rhodopila sp.]
MAEYTLSQWLTLEIYQAFLVFVRIGAAFLLLPGFGEPSVPVRMRVLAAFALAICIAPGVPGMPRALPDNITMLVSAVAEAVNGALLGTLSRTVISGVLMAGQIISQNIALTNVFAAGLVSDDSSTIGAALYAGIIAILFASHGHFIILRSLADSYNLLPPGHFPTMSASAKAVTIAGLRFFRLGGQLALPFLLLSLIFNTSLAAVNRAMPGLPVFMIASPIIVVLGLYLMAATVPGLVTGGMEGWSDLSALLH